MENYQFFSGGAKGSDTIWAQYLLKKGYSVKEYTIKDYDNLSSQWKSIIDDQYKFVTNMINRKVLEENTYAGKLVRRDMMQADKAKSVFAICRLDNQLNVLGGTAYAVARAIIRKIPVYIYDQNNDQWWTFSLTSNNKIWRQKINKSNIQLKLYSAVIGTREINENGINTIHELVNKL